MLRLPENGLPDRVERLRSRGRAGIPLVISALDRRRADPALRGSWFERLVETCIRSPLLPGLVRQHEILDSDGEFISRVDLAVPSVRLAVEAHSRRHHSGRGGRPGRNVGA